MRMVKYRTKLYSSDDVREWLESAGFNVIHKASLNFFPPAIYRFRNNNKIIQASEKLLQELPGIRNLGALSFVVGVKTNNG